VATGFAPPLSDVGWEHSAQPLDDEAFGGLATRFIGRALDHVVS
jgi:hypothetical protein